jgi:hypothetical protein
MWVPSQHGHDQRIDDLSGGTLTPTTLIVGEAIEDIILVPSFFEAGDPVVNRLAAHCYTSGNRFWTMAGIEP